jgi:hypothetical protein
MPFDGPPDNFTCNRAEAQYCQVGDLSGKHGKITPENGKYMTTYDDLYVSAIEGNPAFFGNRSIVVHASNGTRLNCANFMMMPNAGPGYGDNTMMPSGTEAPSGSASATSSPSGSATPSPSSLGGVSAATSLSASAGWISTLLAAAAGFAAML